MMTASLKMMSKENCILGQRF